MATRQKREIQDSESQPRKNQRDQLSKGGGILGMITSLETGIRVLPYTDLRTVHSHDIHTILSALAYSVRDQDQSIALRLYLCKEIVTTYLYYPSTTCLKSFFTACVNRVTQSVFEEGAFLLPGRLTAFYNTRKSLDILRANLETSAFALSDDLQKAYTYFYDLQAIATSHYPVRYQSLYNLVIAYLTETRRCVEYTPDSAKALVAVLEDPVVIRLTEIDNMTSGMTFKKWIHEITSDVDAETKKVLEYLFKGAKQPFLYVFTYVPFLLAREAVSPRLVLPDYSRNTQSTPDFSPTHVIPSFCTQEAYSFPACIYTHIAHIDLPEYQTDKYPSHHIQWDRNLLTESEKVLLEVYNVCNIFHEKDI